jgi:VWFA-related protein
MYSRCSASVVVFVALLLHLEAQCSQPAPQPFPAEQTASSPSAAAKASDQGKPGTLYESSTVLRATTRLVVVDVVAMDGKGAPVTDLKADDFTVLENGLAQRVRVFSFHQPSATGSRVAARGAASVPKLPEHIFTNVPSYKVDGALNVILLDGLNTNLENQMYAREEMIKLLEKLPMDRPVAVYVLGQKLQLLQDFTSDPAVLQSVIRNYKGRNSQLLDNPSGAPQSDPLGLRFLPAFIKGQVVAFLKAEISVQTDMRVGITMQALNSLARTLAGWPGRKNLIWVSETFPLIINNDSALSAVKSGGQARDYSQELAKTAEALMSAQIAVYPVDARGMANSEFFRPGNIGYNNFGEKLNPGKSGSDLADELVAARSTMNDLADRTGGKAFYNTNDFDKAIRNSMDDGSTYYTLGYYPEDKNWNGKFRKIQVKTDRSGIRLRYRIGYFAADPRARRKEDAQQRARDFGQALDLDVPVSTALLFQARVLPPSKTNNKVEVALLIDAHALSFDHEEDGLEHADIDCAARVYSEKAVLIKTEATSHKAALKPDVYQQVMLARFFPCQISFELPAGDYILRLGVRDSHTGLIGTGNATVKVATE